MAFGAVGFLHALVIQDLDSLDLGRAVLLDLMEGFFHTLVIQDFNSLDLAQCLLLGTCTYVGLLGPCFETGRMKPFCHHIHVKGCNREHTNTMRQAWLSIA